MNNKKNQEPPPPPKFNPYYKTTISKIKITITTQKTKPPKFKVIIS